MTVPDAAKVLDLPADASPEQIHARFLDLRAKLEDKIAKAPTPGLKEKYRSSLTQLTEAFEVLTIAADSSLLPILQPRDEPAAPAAGRADPGSNRVSLPSPGPATPTATSPGSQTPRPRPVARKSGREFALVSLLAAVLLLAAGWFVLKTRAENEEKARIAAAAIRQAELDRQAEEARKAKELADARADQERRERLTVQLRTQLAEARIAWESLENETRTTERALGELKSELRNAAGAKATELQARVGATQRYLEWVTAHLEKHPVRITRAKTEELLSARMPDDARPAMEELQAALATLAREIPERKRGFLSLEGSLKVESDPAGLAFSLVDAFGRSRTGTTPATLSGVAPGPALVTFKRPGFTDVTREAAVTTGATATTRGTVLSQQVVLQAESDVIFWVNGKHVGRGSVTVSDLAPGEHKLQFSRPQTTAFPTSFKVKQEPGTITLAYSYAAVTREDRTCSPCSGRGNLTTKERCSTCRGRGQQTCGNCNGRGANFLKMFADQPAIRIGCSPCAQSGRVSCDSCSGRGQFTYTNNCSACGGDGKVSQLQLANKN